MKNDKHLLLRMAQIRAIFPHNHYMREYEVYKGRTLTDKEREDIRAVWLLRVSDKQIVSDFENIIDNLIK